MKYQVRDYIIAYFIHKKYILTKYVETYFMYYNYNMILQILL